MQHLRMLKYSCVKYLVYNQATIEKSWKNIEWRIANVEKSFYRGRCLLVTKHRQFDDNHAFKRNYSVYQLPMITISPEN